METQRIPPEGPTFYLGLRIGDSDLGLVSSGRPPGHEEPGQGGAASLDHALWLHRTIDLNQWHCYDAIGVSHHDARGLAFGSIHDSGGRLVASVAQESLWRI